MSQIHELDPELTPDQLAELRLGLTELARPAELASVELASSSLGREAVMSAPKPEQVEEEQALVEVAEVAAMGEEAGCAGAEPQQDELQEPVFGSTGEVPCGLLIGSAGTGKTYLVRELMQRDPKWGLLAATTGIAAINLGTITINSLFGYFDTESLQDQWVSGRIKRKLNELGQGYKTLVIDEVSMMDGMQLDIIYKALAEYNNDRSGSGSRFDGEDYDIDEQETGTSSDGGLRLLLVADFCQLPPVKAKWAFEAECWPEFQANTTRLTEVKRQADPLFIGVMNSLREGNGRQAVELLDKLGVRFYDEVDSDFAGTTILAKNDQVDRQNQLAQMNVKGELVQYKAKRRGLQRGEWAKNIPSYQQFKVGSYVMLLANSYDWDEDERKKQMIYANGDCGYIRKWEPELGVCEVELVRTGELVRVGAITRTNTVKQKPEVEELRRKSNWVADVPGEVRFEPYLKDKKWVVGEVVYLPMRLAYASTVHKCQGVSLDKCQIDLRPGFMSSPGMVYVAFSRCRTAQGLRIVGTRDMLVRRCQTDEKVRKFL